MIGLIIILAIAYACARGIENGMGDVSKEHKKRVAKTAKKSGRRTGAKMAAWTATGATAAGTFGRGFKRGWQREWPKAKQRAATKFGRCEPEPETSVGDDIGTDGAPVRGERLAGPDRHAEPAVRVRPGRVAPSVDPNAPATPARPGAVTGRPLTLIKNDDTQPTITGDPMALANIPEITGVNTLKAAVARTASEATVTAEEASAMAQRAKEEMAAIEAMIEQADGLEFGDDGGTLQELAALRDMCVAASAAAQALQKAMVDKAAIAAQSSKNIHDRHTDVQEAIAARGGRIASKQAYTADV